MTALSPVLGCFHCLKTDHWQQDCQLLQKPDDEKDHLRRLAEIKHRFDYEEIGPKAKTRMITTENALWKERQKQLAKA